MRVRRAGETIATTCGELLMLLMLLLLPRISGQSRPNRIGAGSRWSCDELHDARNGSNRAALHCFSTHSHSFLLLLMDGRAGAGRDEATSSWSYSPGGVCLGFELSRTHRRPPCSSSNVYFRDQSIAGMGLFGILMLFSLAEALFCKRAKPSRDWREEIERVGREHYRECDEMLRLRGRDDDTSAYRGESTQ